MFLNAKVWHGAHDSGDTFSFYNKATLHRIHYSQLTLILWLHDLKKSQFIGEEFFDKTQHFDILRKTACQTFEQQQHFSIHLIFILYALLELLIWEEECEEY